MSSPKFEHRQRVLVVRPPDSYWEERYPARVGQLGNVLAFQRSSLTDQFVYVRFDGEPRAWVVNVGQLALAPEGL